MPSQKEIRERDIRFISDEKELAGTLTLPDTEGPFPAVLLLTGAGQIDRNETGEAQRSTKRSVRGNSRSQVCARGATRFLTRGSGRRWIGLFLKGFKYRSEEDARLWYTQVFSPGAERRCPSI
ncbi:MAG TPA: hypothetical protein VFV38_26880 [Ktedonobacteraceae bacterium]|nr:hypothetical protein [Ktedonobacteraceae bacterium]